MLKTIDYRLMRRAGLVLAIVGAAGMVSLVTMTFAVFAAGARLNGFAFGLEVYLFVVGAALLCRRQWAYSKARRAYVGAIGLLSFGICLGVVVVFYFQRQPGRDKLAEFVISLQSAVFALVVALLLFGYLAYRNIDPDQIEWSSPSPSVPRRILLVVVPYCIYCVGVLLYCVVQAVLLN